MATIQIEDILTEGTWNDFHEARSHSYLKAFASGNVGKDHVIQTWLPQQLVVSRSFADLFGVIKLRLPHSGNFDDSKRQLNALITPEGWENMAENSHPHAFAQMAKAIDPDLDLGLANPPPIIEEAQQYVLDRRAIIEDGSVFYALGALSIHEYLNADTHLDPEQRQGIMASYRQGLQTMFGDNEDVLGYANAHVRDECGDLDVLLGVFAAAAAHQEFFKDKRMPALDHATFPDGFVEDPHAEFNAGALDYLEVREKHLAGLERSL